MQELKGYSRHSGKKNIHNDIVVGPIIGVRGLAETHLFVHVYTRGCWIYSQLAISENPKSYILPTVHENTMTLYLLV